LVREAIDEIEVDPADARIPQSDRGTCRLLKALDAIDRALHDWVEALHAEARAGDARLAESRRHSLGQGTGVDLDGDLRACPE
jgi:hypothetical protein